MDKQVIINRLADICYRPKTEDDDDYAVQMFVEALVLPAKTSEYTVGDMKKHIEIFIRDMKLEFGEEDVE
jgi:hypothetical protein